MEIKITDRTHSPPPIPYSYLLTESRQRGWRLHESLHSATHNGCSSQVISHMPIGNRHSMDHSVAQSPNDQIALL